MVRKWVICFWSIFSITKYLYEVKSVIHLYKFFYNSQFRLVVEMRLLFLAVLLLNGRCYEAETWTILFLLRWAFASYVEKSKFDQFD